MRIVLINPANQDGFRAIGFHFPPLGLLGACQERQGYQVEIRDFCNPGPVPDYAQYDAVGISIDTTRHVKVMQDVWRMARRYKLGLGTVFTLYKGLFLG